jgi:hypothetical protein
MKIKIKTILIITILHFAIVSKGQNGTITIKKQDTSIVTLSIANKTNGLISKKILLDDPTLRLENNTKNKYSLKSYTLTLLVNGAIDDFNRSGELKLTVEQLRIIKSAEIQYKNKLLIDKIIVIDMNGNELKLAAISLKIL